MEWIKFVAKHSFLPYFRLEGGILSHKGSMEVPACFKDKLEITSQDP